MKNYTDPHLEKKTCQLHVSHCSLNQDLCAWWLLITVVRGGCVGMLDKRVRRKMLSGECDLTAFSSCTLLTSNWNRRMVCEFYRLSVNASKVLVLLPSICLIMKCLLSESDLSSRPDKVISSELRPHVGLCENHERLKIFWPCQISNKLEEEEKQHLTLWHLKTACLKRLSGLSDSDSHVSLSMIKKSERLGVTIMSLCPHSSQKPPPSLFLTRCSLRRCILNTLHIN